MKISAENAKYATVALIWAGVLTLGIILAVTGSIAGEGLGGFMGAALFVSAALTSGVIFKWGQIETVTPPYQVDEGKAKNDQRGLDPVSLLTDEDIAELREDIKMSMRRRLLQGEDGELNSIDALLADQEQRKRR